MLRFSEMWQIKWVETVHDQTIIERFPRSSLETRELFLKALSIATKVIATSESLREFLVEAGVGQSKIVVGRPLLPGRGVEEPLAQRYQSFFAEHAPVWITIGAFIPLYDFVTVAAAFRRLLETQPNAGLVVVSGSFSIDETYRRRVLSLVSPVSQNVVFLEDVANEDVIALLRASNVLIRGPERESFGLSRAEAILVGTPVVATETGESAFTTPYKFGVADSILEATELVATLEPETMRDGRSHYQRIESDDLTVILDVYRELAAIGHLPSSMK
jgi:glycosyltransferase involved in cell wall biosynthesis